MPMTPEIRRESRRGVYVHLWLPPAEIDWDDYEGLKRTMVLNAAYSLFTPGGHKSQGHAMIRFKRYPGLSQRWFGKTTEDSLTATEDLWRDTFLTDRTQAGGVEALVRSGSPARYQRLPKLISDTAAPKGRLQKWFFPATPAQAARGTAWINGSGKSPDPLRGPRWGFGRGCTNWVHGALVAAGIVEPALSGYRRVFVHDGVWKTAGVSLNAIRPWRAKAQGAWVHPVDFLTPRLFRKLLRERGFAGGDV